MKKLKYRHLGPSDRLQIYALLIEGLSLQEIAHRVGFHKSTIYRELSRNSSKIGYRPDFASQQYLLRRRHQVSKIEKQKDLQAYIVKKLKEGWSPEQISGRLFYDRSTAIISHEAIYQYIYSPLGRALNLYKYLRRKRSFRYPRGRRKRHNRIADKPSIHGRPDAINDRLGFGHWEGDLILFRKTQTNMFTLRERKTRFIMGLKNESRRSKSTSKTLIRHMKNKEYQIHTLTLDNGAEFSDYKSLSAHLRADIYFCDPYKSYQKGAIENGNRLLREKLPKYFPIDTISQKEIDDIVDSLNNRPMKILNFNTPKERFLKEIQNKDTV